MAEERARIGDIDIAYETFGSPGDPAMLLVMGLGTQMIAWHDDFCAELAGHGYHVIRFDNRDVGRSTAHARPPGADAAPAGAALQEGRLLHAVGHGGRRRRPARPPRHRARAHRRRLDGRDDRPDRSPSSTRSACSRWPRSCPTPAPASPASRGSPTYRVLLATPPKERDAAIEHTVKAYRVIGSPGFDRDEDDLRRMAGLSYDRGRNPAGSGRQLARDHRVRRPLEAPRGDPRRRPSSSTAPRTSSSPPAAAGPPRRRSPARAWSRSRAWATTSRAAPGRRSSARSPRTRRAPASPALVD